MLFRSKEIQEFKGVSRKSSIDNVISLLKESYNVSGDVVIDIGMMLQLLILETIKYFLSLLMEYGET